MLSSLISNVMGQTASEVKSETDAVAATSSQKANCEEVESAQSKEPLEWKFIDFSKAQRSPIFDVDPLILKKFIGHNVTVLSISRERYHGCCLAIDPVSLSVILAKRVEDGKIRVITVPGYYLSKITVVPNSVPAENNLSVNDLDVAELYHAPSLYRENATSSSSGSTDVTTEEGKEPEESQGAPKTDSEASLQDIEYTPEEISKRKNKLLGLLLKNRMPVTANGDVLEMPGGVKILPPYTIDCCDTSNKMIQKKLNELIDSL